MKGTSVDPFLEFRMMSELNDTIKHTLQVKKGGVEILNHEVACGVLLDKLIFNAVFHPQTQIKATTRWLIKAIAQNLNIFSSSTQSTQQGFHQQTAVKMNIPVLQIPHLSYDIARAVFQTIQKNHIGTVIFELEETKMELGGQSPGEFSVTIFAAAIREKYQGPIFIQGRHINGNMESFQITPDKEIQKLKNLIIESIAAGIYNLWINGLSLLHSPQTHRGKNQNPSAQLLAFLTDIIRCHEPKNLGIAIGGIIKGSGDLKTVEKDMESFLDDYRKDLQKIREDINGICKISFQPYEPVPFEIASIVHTPIWKNEKTKNLADLYFLLINQYGLSGRIPLNSLNLSNEVLEGFSGIGGMEFPLNIPYQNLFIGHADLPKMVRRTLTEFLSKPSQNTDNNIKKTLWTLPHTLREDIRNQFEEKLTLSFKTFKITNTLEDLQKNTPNPKIPLSLAAEMEALQK